MAISGAKTEPIYKGTTLLGDYQQVSLSITWKRVDYSIRNSTSTILIEITQSNNVNVNTTWGERPFVFTYPTGHQTGNVNLTLGKGEEQILHTATANIQHGVGGGKYPFSIVYQISLPGENTAREITLTGELDALPTAQPAKITFAPNFTDEDNPTITYSNPFGAEVQRLRAFIVDGTTEGLIYVDRSDLDPAGSTYTFELTDAERVKLQQAMTSNSLTVRFGITTWIYNEPHNEYSILKAITLADAVPILNPEVLEADFNMIALTGNTSTIVRGHNYVYFNVHAEGRKGATIVSQSVSCGTKKSTSSSGHLENVESNVFTFTATDDRGATASKSVVLDFVDYVKVSCRQTAVMNEDGTVKITVEGSYYDGSFGLVDNELLIETRRADNGGAFTAWTSLAPLGYITDGNTYKLEMNLELDNSSSYVFQFRATDKLTTAESDKETVAFTPIFDWSQTDFNFNVPVSIQGNRVYSTFILYDTTGGSNGNIVLNDDIDNYDFIDIYFTDNNNRGSGSVRLFGVGGGTKTVDLSLIETSSATNTYIRRTAYYCKDRTLSPEKTTAGYVLFSGNAVSHYTGESVGNLIKVYKVLGYK